MPYFFASAMTSSFSSWLARCGEHVRAAKLAEKVRPRTDARILAEEVGTTYGICMTAVFLYPTTIKEVPFIRASSAGEGHPYNTPIEHGSIVHRACVEQLVYGYHGPPGQPS